MNHDAVSSEAIVAAHGPRFGTVAAPAAPFSSPHPVYRAAKAAALTLGFVDADAECLACAWHAQSMRSGRFDAAAWPVAPVDFGMGSFPPAERRDAFAPCPERLGLYAVLPDAAWVGRMARAGVPTVQLRFKSDQAAAITREVQAAIAAGAYGVHLGQEDLDALTSAQLREIRSHGLRLGLSTHGYAEMVRADAVSPSYIAMGAVFPTTLKKMATAPQGIARLSAYAQLLRGCPQVAIGGIDAARLPSVQATGVGSIAVVRALVAAADPEATVAGLMAAMAAMAAPPHPTPSFVHRP